MSKPALIILLSSFAIRFLLAAATGAGFDEAYYYVYALYPDLSYFDHPPMVALLCGLFPFLTGIASPLTIRLGAVLLFTATGVVLYRLNRSWYGERAAVMSLLLFNTIPLFFLGIGIAILPDAAMAFFWLSALSVIYGIVEGKDSPTRWLIGGVLAGCTLLSKYHGVLLIAFFLLYLVFYHRRAYQTVGPYVYLASAFFVFLPVIIWNQQHDFVSFTFQGGRALGGSIRIDRLFQAIGGQAGYLTPMAFVPLVYVVWLTLRRGLRGDDHKLRLAFFFGTLPVLFFMAVSLVRPILPHWTLAGCLVLTMPLGEFAAKHTQKKKWVRRFITGSIVFIALVLALLLGHIRYGILHLEAMARKGWISTRDVRNDPTLDMVGWEQVPAYLRSKGLGPDNTFLFTHRWLLSGETALATRGEYTVMCFNYKDSRGFGVWDAGVDQRGRDGVCVYTSRYRTDPVKAYSPYFDSIDPPDSVIVRRGGIPVKTVYFARCRNLHTRYPLPSWASSR